jgi:hypothetical protein
MGASSDRPRARASGLVVKILPLGGAGADGLDDHRAPRLRPGKRTDLSDCRYL